MTREHELASMETMCQWVARPVVWLCVATPNGLGAGNTCGDNAAIGRFELTRGKQ